MKDKMMIGMLLLGCVVISSLVTQMTAKPVEAGYGEQEIEYPWELVKIYKSYWDESHYQYYTFNKLTGVIYNTPNPEYPTSDLVESVDDIPLLYQIIPNSKGGCFVMNPDSGETWFITAKGVSRKVLTIPSTANAAPNNGEDVGNE